MSRKVIQTGIPFESLSTVFYSQFIVGLSMAVSLAVSEISSIKKWRDLENWVKVVKGH